MNPMRAPASLALAALLGLALCTAVLPSCAGRNQNPEPSALGLEPIRLPEPQTTGGSPLMDSLRNRRSYRSFLQDPLPMQALSNLLWAAYGINRPESGKRTAPSAMNWQPIDIYVATVQGLYLYEPRQHVLLPVSGQDVRSKTGRFQGFVKKAPVNLVYVADFSKMGWYIPERTKYVFAAVTTGCIAQNVYLYCASEGLATVVRGLIKKDALAEAIGLRKNQKILLAQSVGYPDRSR